MTTRAVTESDFRLPEYRDAKVDEYEFRSDGKLVRKDRWYCAVISITCLVGQSTRDFEIDEVVEAVRVLAEKEEGWIEVEDYLPQVDCTMSIRLSDGSFLHGALFEHGIRSTWKWNDTVFHSIVAWRAAVLPS